MIVSTEIKIFTAYWKFWIFKVLCHQENTATKKLQILNEAQFSPMSLGNTADKQNLLFNIKIQQQKKLQILNEAQFTVLCHRKIQQQKSCKFYSK